MSDAAKMLSVSEVNRIVKETLEGTFYPFWISGEVGNLTVHRSGHVYLTLKDRRSQLSGVFFNGAGAARQMKLEVGAEVEAYGRLSVYEPRGVYQLNIQQLRPKGLGALQARFEELKTKLHAEGLFAEERKRPIPVLPSCIGVVTSTDGAALRDFLNVLERRFGSMHVRIYPASVQGEGAAEQIAAGIDFLNRSDPCDVIVITRGGGSLEDLWSFNDEQLARTIVASRLPVISAVGHEVDFTIADFVADLRVPTPSAAAELVVGQRSELTEQVTNLERRLGQSLQGQARELRHRVERAANHYVFREPLHLVRRCQQRVDELQARLPNLLMQQLRDLQGRLDRASHHYVFRQPLARIEQQRERVATLDRHLHHELKLRLKQEAQTVARLDGQLRALSPRRVLERGYAILLQDQRPVTDPRQVASGDRLRGIVAGGDLDLNVR